MRDLRDFKLHPSEAQILINALAAISRSGGGSVEYTLQRRLMEHFNIRERVGAVVRYQSVAAKEFNDGS